MERESNVVREREKEDPLFLAQAQVCVNCMYINSSTDTMHRQSLGPPAPAVAAGNDRRFSDYDGGGGKSEKPPRPPPAPEKTIHLIPCVVLLCFLVLFLASHDPSRADLVEAGAGAASTRFSIIQGSTAGRVMRAEMEAIHGHRRLGEVERTDRRRSRPRKLGKFNV